MPWAKIDDSWWCHPKTIGLSLAASGLWARALSWSCQHRRDWVPTAFLTMVGADDSHADELVDAGLWVELEGGWEIHDWAEYQEKSLSEKRSEAGAKGGKKSRPPKQTPSNPEANGKQTGSNGVSKSEAKAEAGARPVPSLPVLKDKSIVVADATPTVEDEFDRFWNAYPRGQAGKPGGDGSKKAALQKWRRLKPQQRALCLSAVDNYRAHCEAGTFAAHAVTWLNQERWEQWQAPATNPDAKPPAPGEVCPECHERVPDLEAHDAETCEFFRREAS